jgi:hypothetical protein
MLVTLPGGLWARDTLSKNACFAPLSGYTELALAELTEAECSTPDFVTRVLCLTLSELGGAAPDAELVDGLCVADRQYLMLRLEEMLAGDTAWLRAQCVDCRQPFDLCIQRSLLPVKPAGEGFPFCRIDSPLGRLELRVADGRDQKGAASMDDAEALRRLARGCIVSIDGHPPEAAVLDAIGEQELQAIEQTLDELSPSVCDTLQTDCPECGRQQEVRIAPYDIRVDEQQGLYLQVHTLAYHYHWSEQDILGLPTARRQMYLELIERAAGYETGV